MTSRRRFISESLGIMAAVPLLAHADMPDVFGGMGKERGADQDLSKVIKPYLMVGPFADDRHRVFMFLSYTCPYCASSRAGMAAWGNTLPDPFRFIEVPLSSDKLSTAAATGFYAVRDLAPARLDEYQRLAFEAARGARDTSDFVAVVRGMGFSQQNINDSLAKPVTRARLTRSMMLARRYRVTATPFFGVGGRYTTHAGFTGGDYRLLTQLLNALVSDVIQNKTPA